MSDDARLCRSSPHGVGFLHGEREPTSQGVYGFGPVPVDMVVFGIVRPVDIFVRTPEEFERLRDVIGSCDKEEMDYEPPRA